MRKHRKGISRGVLNDFERNTANWPTVDSAALQSPQRETYLRREKAVTEYLEGAPMRVIAGVTGLTAGEVRRLLKRCLEEDADGRLMGFRALVPYKRIATYNRLADTGGPTFGRRGGRSGALQHLFKRFPEIERELTDLHLSIFSRTAYYERAPAYETSFEKFIKLCKAAGLGPADYPFNCRSRGRTSLWKWLKKVELKHLNQATKSRFGSAAAMLYKSAGNALGASTATIDRPYQRVEFDGHRLDLICSVEVPSPFGPPDVFSLDRPWLLVIQESYSGAILGYHLSIRSEYNSDDVLFCIKSALSEWQPRDLSDYGMQYPEGSGLPSHLFPQANGAVWEEFHCDNAKSHLSGRVLEKLTTIVGCDVCYGPVATPVRRGRIERFFRTLEQKLHRTPSTTGSGPNDVRRKNPEKAAVEYRVTLQRVHDVIDVEMASYNTLRQSGMGGRSPLEMLEYAFSSELFTPRQISPNHRENLELLDYVCIRQVRGNVNNGRRPYVHFEGQKYSSPMLAGNSRLIGEKLRLLVNPDDICSIRAQFTDGSDFDVLRVMGPWSRAPHTLTQRKQANARCYDDKIQRAETGSTITKMNESWRREAPKNRSARRHIALEQQAQERRQENFTEEALQARPEQRLLDERPEERFQTQDRISVTKTKFRVLESFSFDCEDHGRE